MAILPTGTDIQIATDAAYQNLVVDASGAYTVSKSFVKGDLPYGVNLYARVRHTHPQVGTSYWSPSVTFKVITPANIIGVCLDNSDETKRGVFYWIDAAGNKKDSFDFTTHPTFDGITMASVGVTADSVAAQMTKIPLFYVKTATSGPAGSFSDGKKCWWISDYAATGFRPAACFKRSSSKDANGKFIISPYLYVGTYLGNSTNYLYAGNPINCLSSNPGPGVVLSKGVQNPNGIIDSAVLNLATARNNASLGSSGWRALDIWDLGALRLLYLIMKANADSQTVCGDNTTGTVISGSSATAGTTGAKVIFKGTAASPQVFIDDMWKCVGYLLDKIAIGTGFDITGPYVTAGTITVAQPSSAGWIRDIVDQSFVIGDDIHDIMELFLPKTVVTSEALGTFYDKYEPATSGIRCVAGKSATIPTTTEPGIFYMGTRKGDGTDTKEDSVACRLAKS